MYLGVDGGGTKTAFVIIDGTGRSLAEHQESGSYYLDIGLDGLRDLLEAGVNATLSKAKLSIADIRYAFFGLPAYGEDSGIVGDLDSIPSRLFSDGNYSCDNDMVCGWAGSLACQDGINLIAGTGSIAFGRFQGTSARCGGWGEVFSDEGSAYWIACRGLQLFSKMSDGRTERGPLYDLVRSKFDLAQDLDMSTIVLNTWNSDRAQVADFARLMVTAAHTEDRQVVSIFERAAEELVEIVDATRVNLDIPSGELVRVSYSGGIFESGSLIVSPFEQGLEVKAANYQLCKPRFSPVLGAAYFAAILGGSESIRRLLSS